MSNKTKNEQDFEQSGDNIEQPSSQKEESNGENIINSTQNFDKNQSFSEENKKDNFSKIADPVSVIEENSTSLDNAFSLSKEEDVLLFNKLFPGVLRQNIENDEVFKLFYRFADKNTPFISVYTDFLSLVDKISADAIKKHKIKEQNKQVGTGALASSAANQSDFFTRDQVLRMNREQIAKNYDNIRKSQEKW